MKHNIKEKILICTPMVYTARIDEECFFYWLEKIACAQVVGGAGEELYIKITGDVSREDTIEFIGFFKRYGLMPEHLKTVCNDSNKDLIEDFLDKKLLNKKRVLSYIPSYEGDSERILTCGPLNLYSILDQYFFFDWLNQIECVKNFKKNGEALEVKIVGNVSLKDTRNLLGLFRRYIFKPVNMHILINQKNEYLIKKYLSKKMFTAMPIDSWD